MQMAEESLLAFALHLLESRLLLGPKLRRDSAIRASQDPVDRGHVRAMRGDNLFLGIHHDGPDLVLLVTRKIQPFAQMSHPMITHLLRPRQSGMRPKGNRKQRTGHAPQNKNEA